VAVADAICPLRRSTEIIALGFANGMRALRIRCTDCGRESELPYPKPPDPSSSGGRGAGGGRKRLDSV